MTQLLLESGGSGGEFEVACCCITEVVLELPIDIGGRILPRVTRHMHHDLLYFTRDIVVVDVDSHILGIELTDTDGGYRVPSRIIRLVHANRVELLHIGVRLQRRAQLRNDVDRRCNYTMGACGVCRLGGPPVGDFTL